MLTRTTAQDAKNIAAKLVGVLGRWRTVPAGTVDAAALQVDALVTQLNSVLTHGRQPVEGSNGLAIDWRGKTRRTR